MGMIRRFIGSLLCIAGGALGTYGWAKYESIGANVRRLSTETLGLPKDDSTTLAIVLMAVGAALALFGVGAVVRKDKA